MRRESNLPTTTIATRQDTNWANVSQYFSEGPQDFHALQIGFTKRFSDRWQSPATYLLSATWDEIPPPDVGFALPPDMGAERAHAVGEQRHRLVFNDIVDAGCGFQLSRIYFFGSGQRYSTPYGGDLRRLGLNPTNGCDRTVQLSPATTSSVNQFIVSTSGSRNGFH